MMGKPNQLEQHHYETVACRMLEAQQGQRALHILQILFFGWLVDSTVWVSPVAAMLWRSTLESTSRVPIFWICECFLGAFLREMRIAKIASTRTVLGSVL
jgi:hypothetical protein